METELFWQPFPPGGSIVFTISPLRWRSSLPANTYMLKMNVSLAGHVVDYISDVLLSAAADEVLLWSSVLQKVQRTQTQFHWRRLNLLIITFRQQTHLVQRPHQHADVHGQVDLPSGAVVGRCSQTCGDSVSFTDVTGCVVRVHVFHSWQRKKLLFYRTPPQTRWCFGGSWRIWAFSPKHSSSR